ncbi:MAG TPA: hypothetical protein VF457_08360 [Burkholderiaceae bacterium]
MPILDPVPGAPPRPDDFAHLPRLLRPATLGAVIFWIWAVTAGGIFYLATQYGLAGSDAGTDAFLALAFVGLAVAVFVVPGLSHSRYFTVEALADLFGGAFLGAVAAAVVLALVVYLIVRSMPPMPAFG